jgi:prevent-host-death family protein
MQISIVDAKGQLTELVRRAESGEEIILTEQGHAVVGLVPIQPTQDIKSRRVLIDSVRVTGAAKSTIGRTAARSQDFLYGNDSVPG